MYINIHIIPLKNETGRSWGGGGPYKYIYIQAEPLPLISGVISPMNKVVTPVTH